MHVGTGDRGEFNKHQRDYHKTLGKQLAAEIKENLANRSLGHSRTWEVCRHIMEALDPPMAPPSEKDNTRDEICHRLADAIAILSTSAQCNSNLGKERRHFLEMMLSDPQYGKDDPMIALIAKELKIKNVSHFRTAAANRQEYGFDYILPHCERKSIAREWIPVRQQFIVFVSICCDMTFHVFTRLLVASMLHVFWDEYITKHAHYTLAPCSCVLITATSLFCVYLWTPEYTYSIVGL